MSFASVTVPYSSSKCCFELVCSRHNPMWSKWRILNPTDPQSPLWTYCAVLLLFTISSQLHTAWIVRSPSSGVSPPALQAHLSSPVCVVSVPGVHGFGGSFSIELLKGRTFSIQLLSRSRTDVSQRQCCSWACYQSHLTCRGEGTVSARAFSLPMEAKP